MLSNFIVTFNVATVISHSHSLSGGDSQLTSGSGASSAGSGRMTTTGVTCFGCCSSPERSK